MESRDFRIRLLVGGAVAVAVVHGIVWFTSHAVEGANVARVLDRLAAHPKAVSLLERGIGGAYHWIGEQTLEVRRGPRVQIFFVEVSVNCGEVTLIAMDMQNRILQWQWDYRYVKTRHMGDNWIVMAVPVNMGGGFGIPPGASYKVVIDYDKRCHELRAFRLIPVNTVKDWPGFLYNENFYRDGGVIRASGTNGYKVMPTKLKIDPRMLR